MSKTLMILIGVFLIIGGILALINPFAASLAVTTLVGIFFTAGGVVQMWATFTDKDMTTGQKIWSAIMALLGIVVGVWLMANPLRGMVSLTLVVGALFFVTGLVRIFTAFGHFEDSAMRWVMILSGAASVIIGLIIFFNFAAAAASFLGILLGIQLLFEGIGLIAMSFAIKKLEKL